MRRLNHFEMDLGVLAGYMLIVGRKFRESTVSSTFTQPHRTAPRVHGRSDFGADSEQSEGNGHDDASCSGNFGQRTCHNILQVSDHRRTIRYSVGGNG